MWRTSAAIYMRYVCHGKCTVAYAPTCIVIDFIYGKSLEGYITTSNK